MAPLQYVYVNIFNLSTGDKRKKKCIAFLNKQLNVLATDARFKYIFITFIYMPLLQSLSW